MKEKSEEEKKFENELIKLKITAEHGATFFENNEIDIPADIESQWLNNVMAFKNASKNQVSKRIKEVLENPSFTPANKLSDQQILVALKEGQDLLGKHNICLTSIYNASERELYSFITTDFLDEEMEIINIAGMVCHFTYEDFCPNHKEEIKSRTEEIIKTLFSKDLSHLSNMILQKIEHNNMEIEDTVFIAQLKDILKGLKLKLRKIAFNTVEINEEKATVVCSIEYSKSILTKKPIIQAEVATLVFVLQYGYWYAQRISIPNLAI